MSRFLALRGRNPDVLPRIANLSNDLVLPRPRADTHSRFLKTASYGDILAVHVTVKEWRDKSFVQTYRITREDDLIMECEEVRIFATTRNDGKNGIRAVPIPSSIRLLCE